MFGISETKVITGGVTSIQEQSFHPSVITQFFVPIRLLLRAFSQRQYFLSIAQNSTLFFNFFSVHHLSKLS